MKKELVEKGLERMRGYFDYTKRSEYAWALDPDTAYMKAVTKTFEQVEFDDLDQASKVWFLEDEAEFMKRRAEMFENDKKYMHFAKLLEKNLEEIDIFEEE